MSTSLPTLVQHGYILYFRHKRLPFPLLKILHCLYEGIDQGFGLRYFQTPPT